MNFLKTTHWRSLVNPIFFFLLILLIGLSFAFDMECYAALKESFSKLYPYVLSFSIVFGVAFVFLNKEKINEIIEKDRAEDERAHARSIEFPSIYPGLNKIPMIRLITKIMYREGWLYACTFILIIIFSIIILSHDLGKPDLQGDEYLMASAAEGYLHTGKFYMWDYLNSTLSDIPYDRAWPHTWMIAQAYKLFGVSEWSSRIVSVIFGVLFIIIFYFISVFFLKNRFAGLLTVFCLMLHPEYIRIFRFTRMYAVLIPIFILLYLCLFRLITEKNRYRFGRFSSFFNNKLNFNYLFLAPFLFLLIVNYLIHINAMVILPISFIFIIFLAIYLREKKYIILASAGGITAGAILLAGTMSDFRIIREFSNFLSLFDKLNFPYLDFMVGYPFSNMAGITLLVSGFFLTVIVSKKDIKIRLVYLYSAVIFSLFFFIFIADRYITFNYISHIIPIAIMLIVYIMILFSRIAGRKSLSAVFSILLVCGAWNCNNNFQKRFGWLYPKYSRYKDFHPENSYPSLAYQTLTDKYDPQNEVIFANLLRGFYIRDIGRKIKYIDMLSHGQYSFKSFWKDMNTYGAGWVVFDYEKRFNIDNKIQTYLNKFLKKYHGKGVDDTNIEMFYFNKEIIRSSIYKIKQLAQEKHKSTLSEKK